MERKINYLIKRTTENIDFRQVRDILFSHGLSNFDVAEAVIGESTTSKKFRNWYISWNRHEPGHSEERQKMLRAYGVDYDTTGPEIWEDTDGIAPFGDQSFEAMIEFAEVERDIRESYH